MADNTELTGADAVGTQKSKKKRIFHIVFTFLSVLVLLFSVLMLIFALTSRMQGKTPVMFGTTMHVVLTSSMENDQIEDEIRVADLVIAKEVTKDELDAMLDADQTVDLLFWYDINKDGLQEVVVHRIVAYDETHYTARGINPNIRETDVQRVEFKDVVGVKTGRSRVFGNMLYFFMHYPWVLFLLLGVLLVYVMISEIINIIRIKHRQMVEANEKDVEEIRARARADAAAQLTAPDDPDQDA